MHNWQHIHSGLELEYFGPGEFRHPGMMDPKFLIQLDRLRAEFTYPIHINSDARSLAKQEKLYRKEIAAGQPWPKESAHLFIKNTLVRCVDIEPVVESESQEIRLVHLITKRHLDGTWPYLCLLIETGHFHLDDTPRLKHKRPYIAPGVSR